ncbi:MAG: phosphatidylcholine/phosphatidylserine synthase [Beijerinckiaceae bacterium]
MTEPPDGRPSWNINEKLAPLAVHVFTAAGAFIGMLALERAFARDFPAVFGWLALAFIIDGVDGTIARRVRVRERLPHIDGDVLDCVVDYLNYVVVPLTAIWTGALMPPPLAHVAIAVVAIGSSIYFADRRMKTPDNWFRGFPALWNVVALYLFTFPMPGWAVFLVMIAASAAMFVPVVFVHPMRVARLRGVTLAAMALWFVAAAILVANGFSGPVWAKAVLIATGLYFVSLPLWRGTIWAKEKGAGS